MTKRIIQLVVLFIFILFSCIRSNISNKQADTGFEMIEIDDIHATKEILLSDFVKEIKFTPLETSPNSFIIEISELIESGEHLFILDRSNNCVLKFSKDGKFISKIGEKGKGPGEYTQLVDIDVYEDEVYLLDFSTQKILVYDSEELSFITDFRCPDGSIEMKGFQDKFIFYCTSFSSGSYPSLYLTDKDGSNHQKLIDSEYAQASIKIGGSSIFCGEGLISRSNESNLYALSNDSLYTKYKINFGRREMPKMRLTEDYNIFDKDFNYCYRYKTYNCNNVLLFDFFETGEPIKRLYCVYEKETKKNMWGAVKNNFGYENLPFYPTFSTSESLIGVLSPEIFNSSENPVVIPQLNPPQITDNPILVFFNLK